MDTQKKDIEFWLFNQDNLQSLCKILAEVWNSLCSEHGWPHRRTWQEMLRERKAIRSMARQYALDNSTEETKQALFWILRRWNWQKTPAPLNLLSSKTQWNSYKMVLAREKEESQIFIQEKDSNLKDWARMEITNRIKSERFQKNSKIENKADASNISKETVEFALILGKLKGMNTEEKLSFASFCEDVEKQLQET